MKKKRKLNAHRSAALFSLLFLFVDCSHLPPVLSPPAVVERFEGYASLSLSGPEASSKTRLSFLFSIPQKGRMEGFDPLGRSLYQIVLEGEAGFFIIPSKKVYWQAGAEEITAEFLGFSLTLQEMTALLTGEWTASSGWTLARDGRGRVVAGEKRNIRFEIKDFLDGGSLPRVVLFKNDSLSGRLRILRIHFNQPFKSPPFDLSYLNRFESKTREEIEALLRHEN